MGLTRWNTGSVLAPVAALAGPDLLTRIPRQLPSGYALRPLPSGGGQGGDAVDLDESALTHQLHDHRTACLYSSLAASLSASSSVRNAGCASVISGTAA